MMDGRIKHDITIIDSQKVLNFFENRKNKELPHRYNYVNYQDDDPEKVIIRDLEEKKRVGRFLKFKEQDYVLDIGCGVGRWCDHVAGLVPDGKYIGVEYVDFFLQLARENCNYQNVKFYNGSFQEIKDVLLGNGEFREYDKIIINGVLMYLNESDLEPCLCATDELLKKGGFIYLKESVGMSDRLTLKQFYSKELTAEYNVIYRSLNEYTTILSHYFLEKGYTLIACQPTWEQDVDYDKETSNWFWILRK